MYVTVCVSVHECVCVCHVCTYVCAWVCICVCECMCVHAYTCVDVCACMHVCVCMWVYVYECVHAYVFICVCALQLILELSWHSSSYSLRKGLLVTDKLVSLANLFWGPQLCLLRLELQAAAIPTQHLWELWGSELWSLHLFSKCSNHWAISQPPGLVSETRSPTKAGSHWFSSTGWSETPGILLCPQKSIYCFLLMHMCECLHKFVYTKYAGACVGSNGAAVMCSCESPDVHAGKKN